MNTDDHHLARLNRLFMDVVDLDADARERLLEKEAVSDPALVAEVRTLLAVDCTEDFGRITRAIAEAKFGEARGPYDELVGTTLSHYKLISVLGRGGAGTVYLGTRAGRQYAAHVAVKVVGTPVTNEALLQRFNSEHEILASLDHPNIARLLDAGESEGGYPYLVMEYVHGMPIDRFCDEHRLSIESRLRLFLRVCTAVHYAHANLIVHRDLKPGNILVTDAGEPKLLDFGIAKLLASTTPSPALTRLNDRALTPAYASPEQISGRPITTVSDVYSLGVILYELLSGVPPYSVFNTSQLELERLICIVDPPKPSAAVARAVNIPTATQRHVVLTAAGNREVSPNRFHAALRGDIDAIVMRALRKEPEKRYSSVEALMADIQRCLDVKPVHANDGNWAYYAGRFLKRHTVPVTAVSVAVLALIVFSITTAVLYHRAGIDRDHAESVSDFMSAVFRDANLDATQGHEVTALELLDAASDRLDDLHDREVRLRLLNQMGAAYINAGQYAKAVEQLKKAVAIERQFSPINKIRLASTLMRLARAERGVGKLNEAGATFDETKTLLDSQHVEESQEYADLLQSMALMEMMRGEFKSAEQRFLDSIDISRRLKGDSMQVAVTKRDLASLYIWMNRLVDAERIARDAVTLSERVLSERHPDRLRAQLVFGDVLFQRGKLEEAATMVEHAVAVQRSVYRNTGPHLAQSLERLGVIKEAQGRGDDAETLFRESLTVALRTHGDNHYRSGYYHTSLGKFLVGVHRYAEASEHLRAALTIYGQTLPKEHQYVASAQYWLGEAFLGMRHPADAIAVLKAALTIGQQSNASAWLLARTENALGQALADTGERTQAKQYLSSSYDVLKKERGDSDEATRTALARLQAFNAK